MNKILLAAAAALAAIAVSPLSAAEFSLDTAGLQDVKDSVSKFKDQKAPAPVDKAPVQKLFDRLAKDGPAYVRSQETPDGGARTLQVTLVEVAGPPQEEGMMRDLVYRRYFSHLEGVEESVRPQADGTGALERYTYIVSLDGKLQSVKRVTAKILAITPQGLAVVDDKSVHQESLPPADPQVQKRWKNISAELLTMGRTIEV
ncbi:MAG: hypothetical protein NTY77_02330 [Elusimicrobia bacterium]|nr:hypothetical protein [Elusimicrobiota bacterium]